MPLHDYLCHAGHKFERATPIAELDRIQYCDCGDPSERIFTKFPAAFVQADVHYTSPIDDRPITSKQARREDMARNNCMEYDPAMKQDAQRRAAEKEVALDRAVDHTVEAAMHQMPARKREKLEQELRSGADLQYVTA